MALWVYDRQIPRQNLRGLTATIRETADSDQLDERRLQNHVVELALESGTNILVPVAPRPFPRAVAQQSILTVSPNIAVALPASGWIRGKLATCVRLKEDWKSDIQAACASMGLNRLTLFRDLDSLGNDIRETFMSSGEVPDFY
jgi:hypothetical protein